MGDARQIPSSEMKIFRRRSKNGERFVEWIPIHRDKAKLLLVHSVLECMDSRIPATVCLSLSLPPHQRLEIKTKAQEFLRHSVIYGRK